MNLNVIHMLKRNAMLLGNAACVSRKAWEIGGSLIAPPDTPCSKHGIGSTNKKATLGSFTATTIGAYDTHATIPLRSLDDVGNLDVLQNTHIGETANVFQQRGGNLFAGNVTVIADTGTRMGPLTCIRQRAISLALEVDPATDQVVDNRAARSDHDINAFGTILVMARPHGVLIEGIVIALVMKYAYAALGEHGIAFFHNRFRDHNDVCRRGEIERGIQP